VIISKRLDLLLERMRESLQRFVTLMSIIYGFIKSIKKAYSKSNILK
jgi:hypothetical protein